MHNRKRSLLQPRSRDYAFGPARSGLPRAKVIASLRRKAEAKASIEAEIEAEIEHLLKEINSELRALNNQIASYNW